jgi:hypothetical protein
MTKSIFGASYGSAYDLLILEEEKRREDAQLEKHKPQDALEKSY